MFTSKQRSVLRSLAQTIEPVGQIGKGGISDNMVTAFSQALESRELIKITLLNNSDEDIKEIISILKSTKLFVDDDSAVDGSIWDIKYYNEDGKVISDYHGYIYNYKKLQRLSEILKEAFSIFQSHSKTVFSKGL